MTIAEILVVLIVILLVTKPSDIPVILKYIKASVGYLRHIQKDFTRYFDQFDDVDEINSYIDKISALDAKYDGDYNIHSIKAYYHRLIKIKAMERDE